MASIIEKITERNRLSKLGSGQPGNQPVRVQELNEVIDRINRNNSGSLDTTTGTDTPTINSAIGRFTTTSQTTAAGASETFTVTNSSISSDDVVIAWVESYSGTIATNGIPVMYGNAVSEGSVDITIANVHGTNALSGTLTIVFTVL